MYRFFYLESVIMAAEEFNTGIKFPEESRHKRGRSLLQVSIERADAHDQKGELSYGIAIEYKLLYK